jgi:peroxin-19
MLRSCFTDSVFVLLPPMEQMQESGSPPPEVVGDMPAELENIPGFGGAGGSGQPGDEECVVM